MTTVITAVEAMGEADEDGDSSPLLEDPGGWLRSPLEEPRSPHSSRSCKGRRVTGGAPGLEPSSLDITARIWTPVWRKVIVRSSWGSEQALASSEDPLTDTAQGWPPIVFTTGRGTFKSWLWPFLSRYQRYRWYRRRRFYYMDDDFDDDYYTTYYQRLDAYKAVGLPRLSERWFVRQHCRLSICEYWLSWTNTVSEQKIPITIIILKRRPCLVVSPSWWYGHGWQLLKVRWWYSDVLMAVGKLVKASSQSDSSQVTTIIKPHSWHFTKLSTSRERH